MQSLDITHSLQNLLLESSIDSTQSRHLILLSFLAKNNPLRVSEIENQKPSNNPLNYLMRFQEIFNLELLNHSELEIISLNQSAQNIWLKTPECDLNDFFTIAENIFEHISNADIQKKTGSFYTPPKVVELILNLDTAKLSPDNSRKVLDPSCGAGIFLRSYLAKSGNKPEQRLKTIKKLYGIDLNLNAIKLCRFLLQIKCFENFDDTISIQNLPNLSTNIIQANALMETKLFSGDKFDLILANPPFGLSRDQQIEAKEKKLLKEMYCETFPGKQNKYLLFIKKITDLMTKEGEAIIITPNSWLGIDSGKKLRQELVEKRLLCTINSFKNKLFPDLGVETIILQLKKQFNNSLSICKYSDLSRKPKLATLPYKVIKHSETYQIPLIWESKFTNIFETISDSSLPLAKHPAQLTPSIALQAYAAGKGTPKQDKNASRNKVFHSKEKSSATHYPYLAGKDLSDYQINWSGNYLNYGPWLAEHQPIERYTSPRVIIREVLGKAPYLIKSCYTEDSYTYNLSLIHI